MSTHSNGATSGNSVWVIETWIEALQRWDFTVFKNGSASIVNAFRTKEAADATLSACPDHLNKWTYRVTEFSRKSGAA